MKGLLIKDFFTMKKNLIIVFTISLYFIFIILMGSKASTLSEINMATYFISGILLCLFTSCGLLIMDDSVSSKANLYLHTFPIKACMYTYEKYIVTYLLYILGCFTIFICIILNCIVNKFKVTATLLFICFLISACIFIFISIEIPLILKFGQGIAAGIIMISISILIIASLSIYVKICLHTNTKLSVSSIFNHKLPVSIFLFFFCILCSYTSINISKKINSIIYN